jgi:murein DD-endopeptidase MepM/ murein hydrolase activator NlpD
MGELYKYGMIAGGRPMSDTAEQKRPARSMLSRALHVLGRFNPLRALSLRTGRPGVSVVVFAPDGRSRMLNLNLRHPLMLAVAGAVMLAVLGGAFSFGLALGRGSSHDLALEQASHWMDVLSAQREQLADLRVQMNARARALAIQVGDLQAHMIRLDALGERLTKMAGLTGDAFDFRHQPPIGGPEAPMPGGGAAMPGLASMIGHLQGEVTLRASQLAALENLILSRKLHQAIRPQGRPVSVGWVSSPFGPRIDPFTGKPGFHEGMDFAAPLGTPIHAVAAGVVTWAGPMDGFGNMVQINDGEGYSTLYAHSEKLLVHVGETVKRGEVIALVGDTGWSTGPHVHFQVMRDGHPINPAAFIGQPTQTLAQVIKGR